MGTVDPPPLTVLQPGEGAVGDLGTLDEAGIEHTEKDLEAALHQLERTGRLRRPRQDQWRSDLPLPGYFAPPRIRNE